MKKILAVGAAIILSGCQTMSHVDQHNFNAALRATLGAGYSAMQQAQVYQQANYKKWKPMQTRCRWIGKYWTCN